MLEHPTEVPEIDKYTYGLVKYIVEDKYLEKVK